jgi:hypothetical protein
MDQAVGGGKTAELMGSLSFGGTHAQAGIGILKEAADPFQASRLFFAFAKQARSHFHRARLAKAHHPQQGRPGKLLK